MLGQCLKHGVRRAPVATHTEESHHRPAVLMPHQQVRARPQRLNHQTVRSVRRGPTRDDLTPECGKATPRTEAGSDVWHTQAKQRRD